MLERDERLITFARETLRPILLANPSHEVGGVVALVGGRYQLFNQIDSDANSTIEFPSHMVRKACLLDGALFHTHPKSGCPIGECRYSAPSGFDLRVTLTASAVFASPLVQVIVDPNGLFVLRTTAAFIQKLRTEGNEKALESVEYAEWHGNRLAYMLAETEAGLARRARSFYDDEDMHFIHWLKSVDAYVAEFNALFKGALIVSFDPY
jgi:hypothetical protein